MTDNKLHDNLDAWLAQFPEPAAEPKPNVLKVSEWRKKSARFFGFDPDALTWVSDGWGVTTALIDGIMIGFSVDNDDDGEVCFARAVVGEWRSNDVYSQSDLAKAIRFAQEVQRKQRENEAIKAAQADDYANRTMITHHVLHGDWHENPHNKQLIVLNQYLRDGWKVIHIETDPTSTNDWRRYTLTRD